MNTNCHVEQYSIHHLLHREITFLEVSSIKQNTSTDHKH